MKSTEESKFFFSPSALLPYPFPPTTRPCILKSFNRILGIWFAQSFKWRLKKNREVHAGFLKCQHVGPWNLKRAANALGKSPLRMSAFASFKSFKLFLLLISLIFLRTLKLAYFFVENQNAPGHVADSYERINQMRAFFSGNVVDSVAADVWPVDGPVAKITSDSSRTWKGKLFKSPYGDFFFFIPLFKLPDRSLTYC